MEKSASRPALSLLVILCLRPLPSFRPQRSEVEKSGSLPALSPPQPNLLKARLVSARPRAPTARLIPAQGIALGKIPNSCQRGLKARSIAFFSSLLSLRIFHDLLNMALYRPRKMRCLPFPREQEISPGLLVPGRNRHLSAACLASESQFFSHRIREDNHPQR